MRIGNKALAFCIAIYLIFGCAGNTTKNEPEHAPLLTILSNDKKEIDNRCSGHEFSKRHVNCMFLPKESDAIPIPEWAQNIQHLTQKVYNGSGYMDTYALQELKTEAGLHAFVPESGSIPFAESFSNDYTLAFVLITPVNIGGIDTFVVRPLALESKHMNKTKDIDTELWKIIETSFVTAERDSSQEIKFIDTRKAIANELALKQDVEKKAKDTQDYRTAFQKTSKNELLEAIKKYESNDPEHLIKPAKAKIATIEKNEEIDKKNEKIKSVQGSINYCQSTIERYRAALQREREIGQISGYVNASHMYEAASMIRSCEEKLPMLYDEKKKLTSTN